MTKDTQTQKAETPGLGPHSWEVCGYHDPGFQPQPLGNTRLQAPRHAVESAAKVSLEQL